MVASPSVNSVYPMLVVRPTKNVYVILNSIIMHLVIHVLSVIANVPNVMEQASRNVQNARMVRVLLIGSCWITAK